MVRMQVAGQRQLRQNVVPRRSQPDLQIRRSLQNTYEEAKEYAETGKQLHATKSAPPKPTHHNEHVNTQCQHSNTTSSANYAGASSANTGRAGGSTPPMAKTSGNNNHSAQNWRWNTPLQRQQQREYMQQPTGQPPQQRTTASMYGMPYMSMAATSDTPPTCSILKSTGSE